MFKKQLYKDLYKLEKGGVYFLRISPSHFSQEDLECLGHQLENLRLNEQIIIYLIHAEKEAIGFIPKPKGDNK